MLYRSVYIVSSRSFVVVVACLSRMKGGAGTVAVDIDPGKRGRGGKLS